MARPPSYDRDTALDTALDLFWQKGYHATSLKDLEAALAMKPGSIYAAFTSKESLYLAALEQYFTRNHSAIETALACGTSPLRALADHLRTTARNATEAAPSQACMLVKTILNATAEDTAIAEAARLYLSRMGALFSKAFRHALDLGELPPETDIARLARRYQANITALRIEAEGGTDPQALAELAEDMAADLEALRRPS
ncbi:TetR/AcrR family transcriptional regulator [Roseovarius sp. C7]|uniref:TetR/AcrR family transcriptional regulator n=1 Tax=Roseovarius sp. C7 TaxID=3398643 RepID=UPI0039F70AA5